jgi:hypothetical protein
MSDRLLNGFNNGRDNTDGVGGKPGLTEQLKSMETKISKTDGEILSEIKPSTITDNGEVLMEFYMPLQVMQAMITAREDEREKMKAMIQGRIDELRFIIDHDEFKSPYYREMLISELKKLIP